MNIFHIPIESQPELEILHNKEKAIQVQIIELIEIRHSCHIKLWKKIHEIFPEITIKENVLYNNEDKTITMIV